MRRLAQLLDIQPSEERPVFLLLLQSFFTGIFLAFLFSVANGSFLKTFKPTYLPWAYMASGGLGFIISSAFSRLQKKLPYRILLPGVLVALLIIMVCLTVGLHLFSGPWLVFSMFVLLAPIYMLVALQYWNLAMQLFNIRQSKRLFGVLGTGDVLSSFLGFISVPIILSLFSSGKDGDLMLLVLASIGLLGGLVVQLIIFKAFSSKLNAITTVSKQHKLKGQKTLLLLKNPYFLLIFTMTSLSVLGQYFVDFNFMSIAKSTFEKSELTSFIGQFFALIKGIEFLAKTLLANWLLKQYGLKLGLLILPILLLLFTLLAISLQLLGIEAPAYLLVAFAMNKLFDRSLRKAIDDPSIKLLYQPLPSNIKFIIQTQAEGQAKQLGIFLAGGILLLITCFPEQLIILTSALLWFILMGWIFCVYALYHSYRETIRNRLIAESGGESTPIPIIIPWLKEQLHSHLSPAMRVSILKLLESIEPLSSYPYWTEYIAHSSWEVRKEVLSIIQNNLALEQLPMLSERRKEALEGEEAELLEDIWQDLFHFYRLNEEVVTHAVSAPNWSERILAGYWLRHFDHYDKEKLLKKLISDSQFEVVNIAVMASWQVKSAEHWSLIVDLIKYPEVSSTVIPLLVSIGVEALPLLEKPFLKPNKDEEVLIRILQVAGRMKGEEATHFLVDKILFSEYRVQLDAIRILSFKKYKAANNIKIKLIQTLKDSCNYIAWLTAGIMDLGQSKVCQNMVGLLKQEIEKTEDELFFILSLLYDQDAIWRVREYIRQEDKELISLSMEMLDILLEENIQPFLVSWIGTSDIEDRYNAMASQFPQNRYSTPWKRLCNIAYGDFSRLNRWIRATAVLMLGELNPSKVSREAEALSFHSDIFLKETALISIYHIDREKYRHILQLMPASQRGYYNRVTGDQYHGKLIPSIYERILLMQRHPFFAELLPAIRVRLLEVGEYKELTFDQAVEYDSMESHIHFILQGKADINRQYGISTYTEGSIWGLLERGETEAYQIVAREENTKILSIDKPLFYSMAQIDLELARSIYYYTTKTKEQLAKLDESYNAPIWSIEPA